MVDLTTQTKQAVDSVTTGFFKGMDYITILILMLVLLLVVVGFSLFIIYIKSFKHKIRIKEVVNNRKIIIDDFFKEVKDKDGTEWYKLLKSKKKICKISAEAIEINNKGRKIVEVYKLETGEYIPIADKNHTIPQEILQLEDMPERAKKIKEYLSKTNNVICSLEPLTTEQRLVLADECVKANSKVTKTLSELVLQLAPVGMMCLVIIAGMAFWGELAKPVIELSHDRTAQLQIQSDTVKMLSDMKNDVQILKSEVKTNNIKSGEPPN